MANVFGCGFMRAAVLKGFKQINDKTERYEGFKLQFGENVTGLSKQHFLRKSQDLLSTTKKYRWFGEKRNDYTNIFSEELWNSLSEETKKTHTLHVCAACSNEPKYSEKQKTFPCLPGGKKKKRIK